MKKILLIPIFIILAGILVLWRLSVMKFPVAANFIECAAMGNPITESYPRQCRTAEGEVFTEITPITSAASFLPADNESPAAGICAEAGIVEIISIEVNQDIPSPRCQKVATGKYLTIKNNTDKELSMWFGQNKEYIFSVPSKGEYAISKPLNEFLAPGVHNLFGTPYQGSEIWLVNDSPVNKENGTIRGKVSLGPTCPVVKNPPDPACADKPYKTTVQVIEIGSLKSAPLAITDSNNQGLYTISLPAGEYALQPIGGDPLPLCETKNVTVKPGTIQEINLSCDTGIR